MKRKSLAFLLSMGMIITVLGGYSASAAATSTSEATLLGQVTAISGSSITLALGTDSMTEKTGTPPSGAPTDTSGTAPTSTTPPSSISDGTAPTDGTAPSGTAPSDSGGARGGLTLTGETKTITISSSTVITIDKMGQSSSGALSDITVGAVLTVTMSDSTVTAVTIRQAGGGEAQGINAAVTTSTVTVDGSTVNFLAYNIGGSNYFKLRDIAKAISGTDKQFEVGYDSTSNAITLTSGKTYTAVGGELASSTASGSVQAALSTVTVTLDGKSISLTAYSINGNNYIKLRDLASALNFGVTYDSTTGTIGIDTTTGYTA